MQVAVPVHYSSIGAASRRNPVGFAFWRAARGGVVRGMIFAGLNHQARPGGPEFWRDQRD